jgi:uncharacterized protein (TIGR03032 family)
MREAANNPGDRPGVGSNLREIRYRHTPSFADLLQRLGCSLLVSTYQAGKLVAIGVADGKLHFSFHNFDAAMGVAASPARLAVGTKRSVWFLDSHDDLASTLPPPGKFDRCYVARRSHVTGGIHCHELAWGAGGELWMVNTLFSCLVTLDDNHSFVPRWRPPFISELAAEDRCHLNGLAMRDGRPALVTILAPSNAAAGWRAAKQWSGCILDVASGAPVLHGLAMPHSPRLNGDRFWVLNSGCGTLEAIDQRSGQRDVVERFPGYTRGLAFCGNVAFVGLSKIRETAVFGGLPIAESATALVCGVGAVDLATGATIATFQFDTGVDEIFDVQVIPNTRSPYITGPQHVDEGNDDIWIVPKGPYNLL